MQRKIHNQTLFVAALSVYLGLLIVGAPPHVLAQQAKAQAKQAASPTLNRRPLQNLARQLKQQIAAGQIDLDAVCSVSMQATLASNGKLSSSRIIGKDGDAALCQAATEFVSAISDSGTFAYLRSFSELSTTNVGFEFEAKNGVYKLASVLSLESVKRAETAASRLNAALAFQHTLAQEKANAKEQELLRATEITAKEKELITVTRLPRAALESLLAAIEKAN